MSRSFWNPMTNLGAFAEKGITIVRGEGSTVWDEAGKLGAFLQQAFQGRQIGGQAVDRAFFRRQFENGRGITQGQAACSAVVGRHVQSCSEELEPGPRTPG